MSYFRQSGHSKNKIEVELDLSNYARKPGSKKRQQELIDQNLLKRMN